ncbi:MAG: PD-(D/E)XK nuclease family protein [Treponema sp.]|nr:PD-(D/E)XK nuclease family protein [Treponema sp.]
MDNTKNLDKLLTEINHIRKKHDEIAKITGENFNIFQTLRLQSDECSHSRVIAEFLNPNGSHGRGSEFLELFLNLLEVNVNTQNLKKTQVKTEKSIENGRVDILITGNQTTIVIENKIYAADQPRQLARYREAYPKATIIYLTLDGREPPDSSTDGNKNAYNELLSYENHIIKWLEQCKEKSVKFPYLRETIAQYINILKYLTGQARSRQMQDEIIETIFKDANSISAAFFISQNFNNTIPQVFDKKFKPLISEIAKEIGFELIISSPNLHKAWWGFDFIKPEEWKVLKIRFEFARPYLQDIFCGLPGKCHNKNCSNELDKYLRNLSSNSNPLSNWSFVQDMDNYRNRNEEFFIDIFTNEQNIRDVFESKIKELSLIVENAKKQGYSV